jgi:hypothetical protein
MAWIKRNLYFLVGSVVAVILMGLAGFYLFSKYQLNNQMLENLNERYNALKELNNQNPHPGNLPKGPDNIAAAKQQQEQLRAFIKRTGKHFQRIPAIPESQKVSSLEFTTALRSTIDRMQHDATNASVVLQQAPQGYNFSFEAQKNKVTFAAGSLEPLSVQLGEVRVICDVLFQAKINSLDNLRRERISTDDNSGPQSDYLGEKSVTNELAVLTPYEVTFRCFTPELAGVLAGFASSPYALLIKTINVELAPAATTLPGEMVTPSPPPQIPTYVPPPPQPINTRQAEADAFARRYGISPGARRAGEGGAPMPAPIPIPTYTQPVPVAPGQTKGGLPTVLDEKQLKVTLMLHVVKLLPATTAAKYNGIPQKTLRKGSAWRGPSWVGGGDRVSAVQDHQREAEP